MIGVKPVALATSRHSPVKALEHPLDAEQPGIGRVDQLDASTSSRFVDRRIHSWYTSVMAFPDHLVNAILEMFAPGPGSVFFDPYCGSGTALIEAQKKGLRAFGVDANPSSVLASRVKTNWSVDLRQIRTAIEVFARDVDSLEEQEDDPIVSYLQESGMIDRGWITHAVAGQAAAIKRWIDRAIPDARVSDFFTLALIASVVRDLSNVKFGPELYCVPASHEPPNVVECITARLNTMVADLESSDLPYTIAQVRLGDSRDGRTLRTAAKWNGTPAFVVTSPPYPTEHDYTRNARLELVFMEAVTGLESLRRIKRTMIRSHSKGIYAKDNDARLVGSFEPVQRIRRRIEERVGNKSNGFEGQYPKVVSNYFGGMLRHFHTLSTQLPVGSKLAYVVGDEASYKGVHIPTAQLFVDMIERYVARLRVDCVVTWRSRITQKRRHPLHEQIMFLEKIG